MLDILYATFSHRSTELHASLKQVPTTYLHVPCRVEFEPGGSTQDIHTNSVRHWHGYGASPVELQMVVECIPLYTAYDDTATDALAAEIDHAYGMEPKERKHVEENHKRARRYLPSESSIKVLNAWARTVKRKVVEPARKTMSLEQFNEPLTWCFYEADFGASRMKRAQMHGRHDGSNYLFGLYTAILEFKRPGHFMVVVFSLSTVAEPEEANLSEISSSMYAGSYFIEGTQRIGLNPALAGGAHLSGENGINAREV